MTCLFLSGPWKWFSDDSIWCSCFLSWDKLFQKNTSKPFWNYKQLPFIYALLPTITWSKCLKDLVCVHCQSFVILPWIQYLLWLVAELTVSLCPHIVQCSYVDMLQLNHVCCIVAYHKDQVTDRLMILFPPGEGMAAAVPSHYKRGRQFSYVIWMNSPKEWLSLPKFLL